MVKTHVQYEGGLRCRVTHGPSGQTFVTDAPVDNHGRGEAFSPTDLVAAALGTCMLTVMGIVAERHQIDLRGTSVTVEKEMVSTPTRRIKRLAVTITFAKRFDEVRRRLLEQTAMTCPVHHSLDASVESPVSFVYPV